jgi:hypothetical protein
MVKVDLAHVDLYGKSQRSSASCFQQDSLNKHQRNPLPIHQPSLPGDQDWLAFPRKMMERRGSGRSEKD